MRRRLEHPEEVSKRTSFRSRAAAARLALVVTANLDTGRENRKEPGRCATALAAAWLAAAGCGQVERSPLETGVPAPEPGAKIVAVEVEARAAGPDAAPRIELALRGQDGSLTPIAGEYIDAVEFRTGVAAVTPGRELELVRPDGSRSILARELDGLPARASDGALVYAARFDDAVEICRLSPEGNHRCHASFRGTATRLAPQRDGQVVFVGARTGGVSGVWIADASGVRCLTNCAIRAGEPWGDGYRPPPGDAASIRIGSGHVEWRTAEGSRQSAPLEAGR